MPGGAAPSRAASGPQGSIAPHLRPHRAPPSVRITLTTRFCKLLRASLHSRARRSRRSLPREVRGRSLNSKPSRIAKPSPAPRARVSPAARRRGSVALKRPVGPPRSRLWLNQPPLPPPDPAPSPGRPGMEGRSRGTHPTAAAAAQARGCPPCACLAGEPGAAASARAQARELSCSDPRPEPPLG